MGDNCGDFFDLCDDALIAYIAQFAHEVQSCALRGASRRIWARINAPARMSADQLLIIAATSGCIDLCEFAILHGATNFEEMLAYAALGGHRSLCEFAILHGATNFEEMLTRAALGGHRSLCEFAILHGATNFEEMLAYAAREGRRDLCELAI